MSSIASNLVEKTLFQSHTQSFGRAFSGIEEEIAAKINTYRLKISYVKEKLLKLIQESSNPETCTITIKELNKVINYESQENIDKLMNYLSYLDEQKHTIPDFVHTSYLNSVLAHHFGNAINNQKGLLQEEFESNEKLRKLIPSKHYLGVYVQNVNLKDIDALLCFLVLKEFIMLSNETARLKGEDITIEISGDEVPAHISLFNPNFNTLLVFAGEKEQHLYLLFLTDVLELMGPESYDYPYSSRAEFRDGVKKSKFTRSGLVTTERSSSPRKDDKNEYQKNSLPELTLEQVKKFVNILDHDADYKITIENVAEIVKKHKLVWEDYVVNNMFEEIFQRRNVVVEAQRTKPVDAHEVFHALRYKYKKDPVTHQWIATAREYRDNWVTLFKLVGIEPPKYALPQLKAEPIKCNFEENIAPHKPTKFTKDEKNVVIVKDPKPELFKKSYKPEANILIQNTEHIAEVYTDERGHGKAEDSTKNAFQTLVNAKFKDITQKTDYRTVEFDTQAYYKEALRLSQTPELYMTEKINPIYKFMPVKNEVYKFPSQDFESMRITRSAFPMDEVDDSLDPNVGSNRVTMHSVPETLLKSRKSDRSGTHPAAMTSPQVLGSAKRGTTLSSSLKEKPQSPKDSKSRPLFVTSFKILDNAIIRAQVAKQEPNLDAYEAPRTHIFRDDYVSGNKPPFMTSWKEKTLGTTNDQTRRTWQVEALEQALYEQELQRKQARNVRQNPKQWVKDFYLAPREKGFVDHKYPDFLEKGPYTDGYLRVTAFIKEQAEVDVPFKLCHRSVRATDKNLAFGENKPSKM